ncbi:MAG: ATP-grasp domain-containing protein [Nitrospirae bacterium]|nr:ATP-grasp domain-containing protein [Nitrospirota bacterium]
MKRKPVLLVLGGGRLQKKIIKQAEEKGIAVAVVDCNPKAPGMSLGSYSFNISTNDYKRNLLIARKLNISGILTIGTDQPVTVAAKISHELNLPSFISPETALLATNKKKMKLTLSNNNIPTAKYITINNVKDKETVKEKIKSLKFPVVIKPVDSQGQRGVFFVDNEHVLFDYINEALKYSRAGNLIVEEYVKGYEVTASAWIYKNKLYLLILTDRVTYFNPPSIGICLAHIFPSKYGSQYFEEIKKLLKRTVEAFNINEGPLYVQMLLTKRGPIIVELACRVGGGHEEDLIPLVTGVDVRQCLIDYALGKQYKFNEYDFNYDLIKGHYGIFFIVAKGIDKVLNCVALKKQVSNKALICGEFYVVKGDMVKHLTNATDRIGAFLVKGKDRADLLMNAKQIYNQLNIMGDKYSNLIEDIFTLPLKGL